MLEDSAPFVDVARVIRERRADRRRSVVPEVRLVRRSSLPPVLTDDDELTDTGRAVLDFEAAHPNPDDRAIREAFDVSATRYMQARGRLIDAVAAIAYAPTVTSRLRRQRDAARARRPGGP